MEQRPNAEILRPRLNLIRLQRDRIEDLGFGELGGELLGEPGAGGRVAVGEDDRARVALDRVVEEFLAQRVAGQLEALDLGAQLDLDVDGVEEERLALLRRLQLAAGRVWVAVADEKDAVLRAAREGGRERV